MLKLGFVSMEMKPLFANRIIFSRSGQWRFEILFPGLIYGDHIGKFVLNAVSFNAFHFLNK